MDKPAHSVSRSPIGPKIGWREQLKLGFRDPGELLDYLGLDPVDRRAGGARAFPMRVPQAFAERMVPGAADDPLLLQVLPDPDETRPRPGFGLDPVGDLDSRSAPAVLHKYHGRALLMTTGACAVHCRYCFRQHYPYAGQTIAPRRWREALDYLADQPDLEEIILSGGDPLMLSTRQLAELTADLAAVGQIRRLRIHTRMPVVLPDRVTDALSGWLSALPWPVVVVIHANHPREFDPAVDRALERLRSSGAHLLNQAVLMRAINDDVETLAQLMERGFAAGVLPYYLHQLDRVAGSARFEVSADEAAQLLHGLRLRLPGYLVPRLVREQPGAPFKLPVG
ncbi:MAG: EF-P beta-lysylation protein EpmB [Wenzhouxiangella sp.]